MFRLFYISNASPFFEAKMLPLLCDSAAQKNMELGIGGALAFNGSNFGQVLEGDKQNVLDLYSRIKKDPRHLSVNIIAERDVADRFYKTWGMQMVHGFDFTGLERAMQS